MFVNAVCFLFLLKLKWPKNKNIYDVYCISTRKETSRVGESKGIGTDGVLKDL